MILHLIETRARFIFYVFSIFILGINVLGYFFFPWILWSLIFFGPLIIVGLLDATQTKQTIRRNFPILGNIRYLFEAIRPEIQQYFVETDQSGTPFNRLDRNVVYQRSKCTLDTIGFGTQKNLYEVGYEWVNHSWQPKHVDPSSLRVTIGGPDCKHPYSASLLNVGAMSFGALSQNAVLALSQGAKIGNFAHNTGEGGISSYHLEGGADLIWQVGTGYFGCRTEDGKFCEKTFAKSAQLEQVKMIELKISQGAKPGHGGILPAKKITPEIAKIRNVPMGRDVLSPPAHSAFKTPTEFMYFIQKLRDLSGGKPVGFKCCLGKRREFISVCKAMVKTGITPDFITVDGGEGGTGAAPLEFSNYIGVPLMEGVLFVHNALNGFGLRNKIKIIAGGKITSGFGMIRRLSVGADLCYSARAMMMSLGCIQALKCNTNTCPTGITTQNPSLMKGLVVKEKNQRVANFHAETLKSLAEIIGAMGLEHTDDLKPWYLWRRISFTEIRHYGQLYALIKPGELLNDNIDDIPSEFQWAYKSSSADHFDYVER